MKKDRIFTVEDNGKKVVLKFTRPSQSIQLKTELAYRTKFSEALRAGILLSAEVRKMLKERGLWGEEQEKIEDEIRKEIEGYETALKNPELSNEDGLVVVEKLKGGRDKLDEHTDIFTSVTDNTCESVANEHRNKMYVVECVVFNETGKRVYDSIEDYTNRLSDQMALDCYREVVIASLEAIIGKELSSDVQSEYAENRWVSERGLDKEKEETKSIAKKKKRKKVQKN